MITHFVCKNLDLILRGACNHFVAEQLSRPRAAAEHTAVQPRQHPTRNHRQLQVCFRCDDQREKQLVI